MDKTRKYQCVRKNAKMFDQILAHRDQKTLFDIPLVLSVLYDEFFGNFRAIGLDTDHEKFFILVGALHTVRLNEKKKKSEHPQQAVRAHEDRSADNFFRLTEELNVTINFDLIYTSHTHLWDFYAIELNLI